MSTEETAEAIARAKSRRSREMIASIVPLVGTAHLATFIYFFNNKKIVGCFFFLPNNVGGRVWDEQSTIGNVNVASSATSSHLVRG